jgi:hypothetical protein
MRNLLMTLALLAFTASASLSQITVTTPDPTEPSVRLYLERTGVHDVWNDYEDYKWRKIATVGDILALHVAKAEHITWNTDSTKMVLTFYGKPFLVDRADSLIGVAVAGYDSATVTLHYRSLTRAGNIVSAGPWAQYGATAVFRNTAQLGKNHHDSLITISGAINWKTSWSQLVQFRYTVTSDKTLLAAKTKRTMSAPGRNQADQLLWRGQTLLRFKRTEP